jgi:hypothetical protein
MPNAFNLLPTGFTVKPVASLWLSGDFYRRYAVQALSAAGGY